VTEKIPAAFDVVETVRTALYNRDPIERAIAGRELRKRGLPISPSAIVLSATPTTEK
jgi:hypothetical protein